MSSTPFHIAVVLALCSFSGACRPKPAAAPAPPPAPTVTAKPEPPKPPPPPKCEALTEKCTAKSDTRLVIKDSGVSFVPPADWTYASESSGPVAFHSSEEAALVWSTAPSEKPDDLFAALIPLFTRLDVANVKTDVLKKRLAKPESDLDANGNKVHLWEVGKANQKTVEPTLKTKPGTLLIAVSTIGGKTVVGVGFVVKPSAEAQAPLVVQSVQSLRGGT